LLKEHNLEKGVGLYEVLNRKNIEHIKIRNIHGPHYLTKNERAEVENHLNNTASIPALMCKPKTLSIIFEFKDGTIITGSICGKHITFEEIGINGSFMFQEHINFNNY